MSVLLVQNCYTIYAFNFCNIKSAVKLGKEEFNHNKQFKRNPSGKKRKIFV